MFGQSAGQYYYGDCVKIENADEKLNGQTVILNVKTRELFVKVCNDTADKKTATVNLSRFKSLKPVATKTTLSGQPADENNFDQQPIAPVNETVKASKKMTLDLPPYSFTMLTIKL